MMKNAVRNNLFRGFQVNEHVSYNIIQFTDDTLILGEASWENLRTIKALLKGFELVYGLSINMEKSKLLGVGIREQFMQATCNYLMCDMNKVPFKLLGIYV